MTTPYTPVTVQNYNLNAPSDDGSQTPANKVTWAGIKSKLGDPLKTAIETIDTNVAAAIAKLDGGITSVNDNYQVLATDQGKTVVISVASKTITTPDATGVGSPFLFAVLNTSAGDVTIDGSGAQTVDGAATITLQSGYGVVLDTNGSNWFTQGKAPQLATAAEAATGTSSAKAVTPAGLAAILNTIGGAIINGVLIWSVGSNNLTIALKTLAGSDPSASDPVIVPVRSSTIASGQFVARRVTGALSVVVPQGGTIGFTNAMTGLVHAGFIDNAGTVEIAVSQDGAIWTEDRLVSTTAVDTASDSRTVLYSTTARSNVACRLASVGVIATGATAGDWSNAPSRVSTVTDYPLQPYKNSVKAWGNANGAATALADSFNISSIGDNGTGDITFTYAVAMGSANYCAQPNITNTGDRFSTVNDTGAQTTAAGRLNTWDVSAAAAADPTTWFYSAVAW